MNKRTTAAVLIGAAFLLQLDAPAQARPCTVDAECVSPLRCVAGSCATLTAEPVPTATPEDPLPAPAPLVAPAPVSVAPVPVVAKAPVYVAPAPPPSAAAPRTESPESRAQAWIFAHGYLSVAGLWGLGGTGGYEWGVDQSLYEDDSGEYAVQLAQGFHFAGHLVVARAFHIGAFVHKLEGRALATSDVSDSNPFGVVGLPSGTRGKVIDSFTNVNFGVALKAGGGVGRTFIGFAADLGMALLLHHEAPTQRGFWFHPRLQIDVMVVGDAPLRAALFLGFGPALMVAAGNEEADEEVKAVYWTVTPAFQLGGSFGG